MMTNSAELVQALCRQAREALDRARLCTVIAERLARLRLPEGKVFAGTARFVFTYDTHTDVHNRWVKIELPSMNVWWAVGGRLFRRARFDEMDDAQLQRIFDEVGNDVRT